MKRFIKRIIDWFLSKIGFRLVRTTRREEEVKTWDSSSTISNGSAAQLSLILQYQHLNEQNMHLPNLTDVGFRVHSQTDEDGIILFLFSVIGTANKKFVEIGTGNCVECNCANLAINFGWHGLFIDGDNMSIAEGIRFYDNHPNTRIFPPKFLSTIVDRDNVNEVIANAGFHDEIDLLSIDIDGMDYWIWDAIKSVNPRVVVIEANGKFGMRSITVPYVSNWVYNEKAHPHYHGASLPALTKLANKKGYRLIGTNRFGYNAFYLRADIARDLLPVVSVESCRTHPTRENDASIFQAISHLPYYEV
jgi:hypothetical protein